jgi:flagellar biosynthesis protein FlhB
LAVGLLLWQGEQKVRRTRAEGGVMKSITIGILILYLVGLGFWMHHSNSVFENYVEVWRSAHSEEMKRKIFQDEACTSSNLLTLNPLDWVRYWKDAHTGPCE